MLTKYFLFTIIFQFTAFHINLAADQTESTNNSSPDIPTIPPRSKVRLNSFELNCTFERGLCNWTNDKFSDAPWHITTPIYAIPPPPQGKKFLRLNYNRKKKWGERGRIFLPAISDKIRWLRVDFWFYVSSPGLYTYTAFKLGLVNEPWVFHWLFGSPAITNGWDPKWIHVSLCVPKIQPNRRLVFFGEAEKGHEVAVDEVVITDQVEPCNKSTLLSPKVLAQSSTKSSEETNCPNLAANSGNNKDVSFTLVFAFLCLFSFCK